MSIDDSTVFPSPMFSFNVQSQFAREFGLRTDVPWRDLEHWERDITFLGPGGGQDGGQIVATGTPPQVANASGSVTGEYLKGHLAEAEPAG